MRLLSRQNKTEGDKVKQEHSWQLSAMIVLFMLYTNEKQSQ